MKAGWYVFALLLALIAVAAPSLAADIAVYEDCTLADAIDAANRDVAVGACVAGDGADTIALSADIILQAELPRITTEITVEGGGYNISGALAYRIFYVESSGSLTIKQLTLVGGRAGPEYTPGIVSGDGGAIYNDGNLTISDSTLSKNKAGRGGAIGNGGTLTIDRCNFVENSDHFSSGAIVNSHGGKLVVRNSNFLRNSGYAGGAIENFGEQYVAESHFEENEAMIGGAIRNLGKSHVRSSDFYSNFAENGGAVFNIGELTIIDSLFSGNRTAQNGGAIQNDGDLSIRQSVFTRSGAFWGGALNNGPDGALKIEHSLFDENAAAVGAAIENRGDVWVNSSTFTGNSAKENGGAIHDRGHLFIYNSSFSENRAAWGGALYLVGNRFFSSDADLTHVTMVENFANVGGGLVVDSLPDASVRLYNSILADNVGGDCVGGLSQAHGNIIKDGSCNAELSGDPMLSKLVVPEDGSPAYYPLLPGSPAIDAAVSDHCPDSDQIGTPRPQGEACDIGAIEFLPEQ